MACRASRHVHLEQRKTWTGCGARQDRQDIYYMLTYIYMRPDINQNKMNADPDQNRHRKGQGRAYSAEPARTRAVIWSGQCRARWRVGPSQR